MTGPVFSVITACRNAASEIADTAESVLSQDFTDYEWIVVDGASTDDTCGVARRYLDPTRDSLISEPDAGVYDAMNKGLRIASGEFVVFLNAGDLLAEERTLAIVREAIDETVDVVHGDVLFRLPRGELIHRRSKDVSAGVDRRLFASHQSVYIRRLMHLSQPFDTSLQISADFAALAALHARGAKFRYLPVPLSITTVEPHSISVKGRALLAREDLRINRSIRELLLPRAYAIYVWTRIRMSIVSALKALPPSVLHHFPVRLRRRIY